MNEHRLSRIMHLSLERYVGHLDDVHHNNNNKRRATSETITISESVNVCVSAIPTTCNGSLTKEDSILMEARAAREEHISDYVMKTTIMMKNNTLPLESILIQSTC